jgi:hypothetical protein
MSALMENMKQFYQRLGMWGVYGIWAMNGVILFQLSVTFRNHNTSVEPAYFHLWQFVICIMSGALMGSMQGEALTRPLVFLLPKYPDVLRKILLGCGLLVSGMWCLSFTIFSTMMGLISDGNFLGSFGLNMIGFMLGAAFIFAGVWKVLLFWILIPGAIWQGSSFVIVLQAAAVRYPWATVGLAILLCIMGWRFFGREGFVRGYQGRPWLPFVGLAGSDRYNIPDTQKPKDQGVQSANQSPRRVDNFFLNRIQACRQGTMGYIWGQLYRFWGPMMKDGKVSAVLLLVLTLMFGFFGYLNSQNNNDASVALYIFFSFQWVAYLSLPCFMSQVLTGGRQQRFWATVVVTLSSAFCIILILTYISLEMVLLEKVMPDIPFKGDVISYHAISMKFVWVPLFTAPLVTTLRLLWRYRPFYSILCLCSQFLFVVITASLIREGFVKSAYPIVLLFVMVTWVIFVLSCRLVSMRASLVKARN